MVIAPCKDCRDRVLGCHSHCEKYMTYKKKHDEEMTAFHKEKEIDASIHYERDKRIRRAMKRRGSK